MSIVSRYNSKQLYFSNQLLEKLYKIRTNTLTIVEAPLGYGKTTALHHFLEESDEKFIWMDVTSKDNSRTFDELCIALKQYDENAAAELKNIGYPADDELCDKCIEIMKKIQLDEISYLIIDNYQNVSSEIFDRFLVGTAGLYNQKLHIVLVTQVLNGQIIRDKVFANEINYIDKTDFEFTTEEIVIYYRKCGIKLTEEEAEYLRKYTDGWISAIYLQLLRYIETKSFESNIGINHLINEMFWEKLSIEQQDLLMKLGLFENFTLRQAVMLADNKMNESEIKNLLSSNLLIYYDNFNRKYTIHGLLKFFIKAELGKMEPIFKNDIYLKAGNWYEGNKEIFHAILIYHSIGKYEEIYRMEFGIKDIEERITFENKEMFLKIIRNTPDEVKYENLSTAIVLCFVLFIYHEKDFFTEECLGLSGFIDKMEEGKKRNIYKGNIEILLAFDSYNRLDEMKEHFVKAYEYMKFPAELVSSSISWNFKTPTVFDNLYRSGKPVFEQLETFESIVPYYYKITGGSGKGSEAIMRAEILMNKMDFESAEILCHKALYMAETRHQFDIYIIAMFCLARMSLYKGEYENVRLNIRSIYQKMEETKDYKESNVVDMAESYIKLLSGKIDEIAGWLKDSTQIENKSVVFNIGFANVIYGRYLVEKGEYVRLLGISGQMLGIAGINDNVIYKIYTYIYIAYANFQLGYAKKSETFFNEAVKLAENDDMIVPFIENINAINDIIEHIFIYNKEFMEKVFRYSEIYAVRFKVMKNNDFGLTKREFEIAKLAAQRLTNKEISLKLHISENTVKSNLKIVFSKMDIKSRAQLSKLI